LAVRATIGASTRLLNPQDAKRLAELAVFAANATVPFRLVARLWQATGNLDDLQASQLFARLSELALVAPAGATNSGFSMHDVIRDFLRNELRQQRLAELHGVLLDMVAADLPSANSYGLETAARTRVNWWNLGNDERYMRDHLILHMLEAGRSSEAEEIACDLRWAGARLQG
jgi:hypothetical protein